MTECGNVFEKFKSIREWVHIFKQKETYLYILKNTTKIEDQRKKVAALRQQLDLVQRDLNDAEKKLQDQIEAIPVLEQWLAAHKAEYEVKEQMASDQVQKLAEKVQKERDAAKSD